MAVVLLICILIGWNIRSLPADHIQHDMPSEWVPLYHTGICNYDPRDGASETTTAYEKRQLSTSSQQLPYIAVQVAIQVYITWDVARIRKKEQDHRGH